MAKLAAKKKPTKPDAPKKPSSRSKTGNAECSQAASNWQLSIRGKATLNPGTYQTLAKCRALSKSGQMADAQGRTGKLSAMGEQAVKARLQSRFDSGLITQKSRTEKLNVLLKKRSQAIESGKSAATSEGTVSSIVKRAETPMSEVLMTGHRWKSDGTLQIDRGRYQAAITDEINATLDYAKNGKNSRKSLKEGVGNFPKDHPLHGQAVAYVKGRIDDIPFENLAARTKVKTLESLKTKFAESLAPNTPREQKAAILGNVARSIAKPIPPPAVQAAPQPARYSLQGKLAPGRGTEERNATAQFLSGMRKSGKLKASVVGRTSLMVAQDIRKGVQTPEALTDTLVTMRTKAFLEYPSEYRIRKGKSIGERMDFRIKHHESTDIIARHALGSKGYQEYARRIEEATKNEIQNQQQYFLDGYDKNYKPVKGAYKLIYPKLISDRIKPKKLSKPPKTTQSAPPHGPSYTLNVGNSIDRSGKLIPGYAARITGTDPKYKLKREFLPTKGTSGGLTVSERGLYESRGPSTSIFGADRANKPTEREYILIGRKKVRNLVDFQAERAVRLMERFRKS